MKNPSKGLLALFFLTLFTTGFGQTFEELKKGYQEEFDTYQSKIQKQFDDYVESIDKNFSDYLKEAYQEFQLTPGNVAPKAPKPTQPPAFNHSANNQSQEIIAQSQTTSSPPQTPRLPNRKKTEPTDFPSSNITFDFFGNPVSIKTDQQINALRINGLSGAQISAFYQAASSSFYNHLLDQLEAYKTEFNLNDWGYHLLVNQYTKAVSTDANTMTALHWFLLLKSRYKVRLAHDQNQLCLLLPTQQKIYGHPFYSFSGQKYFLFGTTAEKVSTYPKDFPESDKVFDLVIAHPVNLKPQLVTRKFSFQDGDKTRQIELSINQALRPYYAAFPQSEMPVYLNSAMSAEAKETIRQNFQPLLAGKNELESVSLLLNLIQNLEYKTDQQQFGYEKFFFPEETFLYPYSDCEDRSVAFAYLVKNLTGLDVIGLGYEGHMATAVAFTQEVNGEYLKHNGTRYTIADPTFQNAPVGMVMPQYKSKKPELFPMQQPAPHKQRSELIWQKLRQGNAYRGDNLQDLVIDQQGNAYVTGYFIQQMQVGTHSLGSNYNDRDLFLAKFSPKNEIIWLKKASGPGNDHGSNLLLSEQNRLFLSGVCDQQLTFGATTITATPNPDTFVAEYNTDGQLNWVSKTGIDKIDHTSNIMYTAGFSSTGEKIMARLCSETETFKHYGLSLDTNNNIYLNGSFFASTGMQQSSSKNFNSDASFNPVSSLKAENDDLITRAYEKTIAGLFAATNLLKINTISLKGSTLQATINKHNPAFKSHFPVIYDMFGHLSFMKNASGIVVIKTENGQSMIFDKIKINNNARIKVVAFKSGNTRLDIFSGISVGKGKIWYTMNSAKLFKNTGDLLLDFDDDNTQKKLNIKTDLLNKMQ